MRLRRLVLFLCAFFTYLLFSATLALAQVNTVQLSGTVSDPQGLAVPNAQIMVKNLATGAAQSSSSNGDGGYVLVGLPPGRYSLSVSAKGFATLMNPDLVLNLGAPAVYDAHLAIQSGNQSVTVSAQPQLVQTQRSDVTQTITQVQIENLPINGRQYIQFALLDSQVNRDSAPSIGAAPTSGLNFGGQRARSNEVSVDGADAVDNSVGGVRATVSQEAVQEFQILTSNYMPEFGRAMGGVINIVTKSGSNQVHGDLFGYLRQSSLQARNPFSVQVDPLTGNVQGVKQPFTRVQAGATIGGPIQKDKTFYFFSYETTRRQETGFSDIGSAGGACPGGSASTLFGLCAENYPFFPAPLALTAPQTSFVQGLLASGNPALQNLAAQYAVLAGSASNVAVKGFDFGAIDQSKGVAPCTSVPPFTCFPLPVLNNTGGAFSPALPASFVPLTSLIGNYPVKEGTSLYSLRLDHIWNSQNSTFVRANVSPSLVTGIQVNAQNQNFGENAGSRTSLQQTRDLAIVAQQSTSFTGNLFNEFRYQFARRGLHYGFSQLPGGGNVAVNITGFAFFGREPFSTVDRIEKRNQFTDDLTWVKGNHTFKFGEDTNYIQLGSSKAQIFELNFGGVDDFGSLSALNFGFPSGTPGLTALQAYGLGLPGDFIQGIGNSNRPFNVPSLGLFAQDSWKMTSRFTVNYGVRYDIDWTPVFTPGTPLNAAAEPALRVIEGIPVSSKNVAPRLGFAWDPTGSGKTAIRASYGLFYDNPELALAFDSTTADGALSSQLVTGGGTPTACAVTNPACPVGGGQTVPGVVGLNAASIFQGVLNTGGIPTFGYQASQQRFNPFQVGSIFTSQNFMTAGIPIAILPFTLPTAKNFAFAYAQQGNLTVERELAHDWKIDISYSYTHGVHLNRPRNINTSNPTLLMKNFANALAAGLTPSSPLTVSATPVAAGSANCGIAAVPGATGILGILNGCPGPLASLDGQPVGTAAAFNFFRPSGPNPSFATAAAPGAPCGTAIVPFQKLAAAAGYPAGPAGLCVPWSDVVQQESSGNSIYNGLTLSVTKRFSHHMQLFSNYTWSHAIDDSTDLQVLLEPQDNNLPQLERGNSTFDQRHRWVTSAVFESPYTGSGNWLDKLLANFTFAPIVEVSSGRPYTVLTGTDFNLDFSSQTDRPSVIRVGNALPPGAVTSPFIKGVAFLPPTAQCPTLLPKQTAVLSAIGPEGSFLGCVGDLGRNTFVRPGYFSIDMQLSRIIPITERFNLEVIAEGFNMLNRFNAADVNPLCDPTGSGACNAGQPTAALDQRQFQFALKLHW